MKAIFFLILSLLSGVCFAQTSANYKTYSGPFPDSNSNGKATYSYLTSESGERIFDGHFKYTNGSEVLEGNFKNNRQIGKWTKIEIVQEYSYEKRTTIKKTVKTVNFGENGYLDGSAKIKEFYRDGTTVTLLDATYSNSRLNGPIKGKAKEGDFSGQYKNGVPAGIWRYSWLEFPVDFDKANDYGAVLVKHVNSATGDIREEYENMPTFPYYSECWINDILMRDSRKIVFDLSFPNVYGVSSYEGTRDSGFDQVSVVSGLDTYPLKVTIPEDLLSYQYLRSHVISLNYLSDWDDFVLSNYALDINEIGDSPVTVNLLLDVDRDGNVVLLEKDDNVSDALNNETLRLLKKLQWTFGLNNDTGYSIEKKVKQGMSAYCNVKVTFSPEKMKTSLEKIQQYEDSFASTTDNTSDLVSNQNEDSFAPIAGNESGFVSNKMANDDQICAAPEESPQFPGGMRGLSQFINLNIKYPESAQQNGVSGTVIVGFVVRKDGSISDVKIIRGKDSSLDKEAMRVVKLMPKFKPGKLNGQPVNCSFSLPINFRLSN